MHAAEIQNSLNTFHVMQTDTVAVRKHNSISNTTHTTKSTRAESTINTHMYTDDFLASVLNFKGVRVAQKRKENETYIYVAGAQPVLRCRCQRKMVF